MVDLLVIGISLQRDGVTPELLLHPLGTTQILRLLIGPSEAFAVSSILHGAAGLTGQARLAAGDALPPEGEDRPEKDPALKPRPLTHEFMHSIMEGLGGRVLAVELSSVRKGLYQAEVVIGSPAGVLRLDCRPSDGIALALRAGGRLRAKEEMLEFAEDMGAVLETLPEHIRTLALTRLVDHAKSLQQRMEEGADDFSRIPLLVEAAMAVKNGAPDPEEAAVRVQRAKERLERIERAKTRQTPQVQVVQVAPQSAPPKKQISISLTRQTSPHEQELLSVVGVTVNGTQENAGSEDARQAVSETAKVLVRTPGADPQDEDARFSALLRSIAPATKVHM